MGKRKKKITEWDKLILLINKSKHGKSTCRNAAIVFLTWNSDKFVNIVFHTLIVRRSRQMILTVKRVGLQRFPPYSSKIQKKIKNFFLHINWWALQVQKILVTSGNFVAHEDNAPEKWLSIGLYMPFALRTLNLTKKSWFLQFHPRWS